MIQRIQSIWLLLAGLLNSGVLFFDVYRIHHTENGVETVTGYRTMEHFPMLLEAIVMVLLPLIIIFLFRDRKRQIRMSAICILAISTFLTQTLTSTNKVTPPDTITYWIGAVLPVAAIIFLVMAILGIRKDDKLVKSVDRLR